MKKSQLNYIILGLIIFLGLFLRIIGINKPYGLSYDESVSYIYAIKAFPFEIIKSLIQTDIHMPLYFLLLHLWIKIFSNSDFMIRFLSVIFGELSIFVAYFAGKNFKDEKTGLIFSLLMAINSIVIFYSQEVRFYSLLILISVITLLFFIKTIKKPSMKNLSLFFISNVFLIYTYTISIIFSVIMFFELFLLFFIKKNFNSLKHLSIIIIIGQLLLLPFYLLLYIYSIFHSGIHFQDAFFFDNQTIFCIIQNLFSPMITGIYNNPPQYLTNLFKTLSPQIIIFILLPVFINIFLILKNKYKECINVLILFTALIFIFAELAGSYLNVFNILTRYTLIALPFLTILVANGFNEIKNKRLRYLLFLSLIFINLGYLIFSPNSAPKMTRISGSKIPAIILKKCNIKNQDIVIFPLRTDLTDKYYNNNFEKLSMLNIFSQIYPKTNSDINSYDFYKQTFSDKNSIKFRKYFNSEIYQKLKSGKKLVIITQRDFMPYNAQQCSYILQNDKIYKSQPLIFLKIYKTAEELIKNSSELRVEDVYRLENWFIIVYKKK